MYQFRIAYIEAFGSADTTTVEDLGDYSPWVEFQPRSAPQSLTWTQGEPDGGWPVARRVENVQEDLVVWTARPIATQKVLTSAFETARLWAMSHRRDMRVVIQIRNPDQNPHYYEAQLFDGSVEPDGSARRLQVSWTREPYWRGPETVLNVRTGSDVDWSTYVDIVNHDDQQLGHNNFVFVQAPPGNVPALTRIRISNSYASGRLHAVRIGWYDRQINLVLEGEDSESSVDIRTSTDYSNDAYGTASEFSWEVAFSSVRDFVGPFRVLANGDLAGDRWKLHLGYELTQMQGGRWVTGGGAWTDLGLFMLPPGGYSHPERYPFKAWLESEDSTEGLLDFLHFVPQQQYRRLVFKAYNAVEGACVDDDGIRRQVVYDFSGQRLPMIDAWGDRIQVWPESLLPRNSTGQMLTFNLESDHGAAEAQRSAQVQVLAAARWDVLPEA